MNALGSTVNTTATSVVATATVAAAASLSMARLTKGRKVAILAFVIAATTGIT
jgi:hypothetical protein